MRPPSRSRSHPRAYNPLFIYGGVGLGKTHLMHAIGHHVQAKTRTNVCYTTCEAFTNDYIDALQKKCLVQFRKKYRSMDLLLIDDIHFLGGRAHAGGVLPHIQRAIREP